MTPCEDDRCVTCGDVAEVMRVVAPGARGLVVCRAEDGREATVEAALVEPVGVGEELLVHAGVAIARPA